ncbi:hypothetical protein PIIN_07884 [Serendipita indica DSM 11827]|uniref:CBM1 domain-containing protein n=1 Tax=Serendipita indica (strain DSM 11827) TaxID=1109443 RepID=G4TRI8_SERID|nr:hypothetical protein PIIN_07884 [Serendipita indica DSM 11827]
MVKPIVFACLVTAFVSGATAQTAPEWGWVCTATSSPYFYTCQKATTTAAPSSTSSTSKRVTSTSTKFTSTSTRTASTSTSVTSSSSIATAPEWGQCGGTGWDGPTVCPAGWICTPTTSPSLWYCLQWSTTATSISGSVPSTVSITTAPEWGQCGGINWTGPRVCPAGWVCTATSSPYFFQCLQRSTTTAPSPVSTA